ncbi:MAG: type I restriction-modification system subunit M [Bacilli bacterium]|nr:type I restriction-modification system subunit M [Bacilli bacterium]
MPVNNEREELHRAIWKIADDLRGSVDGWDFKQYILGVMFYRYISEYLEKYINSNEYESGNTSFSYAKLDDEQAETIRNEMVNDVGFFILPSELFCNVRERAKTDENLNETLERVFKNIEESANGTSSENDFKGLFDDIDVNSNKLGSTVAKRNEKLVKVLNGIGGMNLEYSNNNKNDAFGDAYEYLMSMYASNAGKSGGEFFTPQEVSELLMRLATVGKTEVDGVYDPACGSGSLLLKAEKVLGRGKVRRGFFGQEINITTYNLCRINMFLHGVGFDKFNIACEDTLISPQHWDDEPFEVIVSNPPYSIKWAGDENPLLINDPRFAPAGILAPRKKADMAFIMHSLSWLKTNGTAAIVCFPGIMYRGGAEQKIRKYLVDNNFVDCIIQLPDNLFFGTSIATCITVLKKNKVDTNVLFIDASKEFLKVTNNNKLEDKNIDNIVKYFTDRSDLEYIVKVAPYELVKENDYNLSVSTYVEKEDTREKIDIVKLNKEIDEIVAREEVLRTEIKKIIEEIGD